MAMIAFESKECAKLEVCKSALTRLATLSKSSVLRKNGEESWLPSCVSKSLEWLKSTNAQKDINKTKEAKILLELGVIKIVINVLIKILQNQVF